MNLKRTAFVVILACALLMLAGAGLGVVAAQPQTGVYFDNGGNSLVVAESGNLEAQEGAVVTLGGSFILAQQSETVTGSFSLDPASPYIVLTSTGGAYTSSTTTPILTATAVAGQVVIIRNGNASDALTLDGTGGTVECKADVVMGAGDVTTLIFNGSTWNCQSVRDNS